MTSIIKVDDVQNQPGTNIISKCGTDITLGQSGDTIALACGASQTGFGRTGTVDWITTPKVTGDSPVTGVTGKGYFLNTTAGTITLNLPAGAAGSIVAVCDYAGTAASNTITVAANGSEKIEGATDDAEITANRDSITFVYVDATQGWVPVNDNTGSVSPPAFVVATGGTPCSGSIISTDYKVHKFTGDGNFCVSCAGNAGGSNTVDYLVVAGGGGGGGGIGGGGGGGGYRESPGSASGCYAVSPRGVSPAVALPVSVQCYAIVVGGAGIGTDGPPGGVLMPSVPGATASTQGGTSSFSSISSAGGGYGRHYGSQPSPTLGGPGGSGGGGSGNSAGAGGPGNDPVTDPVQGMDGGDGNPSNPWGSGGGGGATTVGANPGPTSGPGGTGGTSTIDGTPTGRAGGGGGGGPNYGNPSGGCGVDGGGNGQDGPGTAGSNATANSGGGGGGGAQSAPGQQSGYNGGTGVVYIRYKFQ